MTASQAGARTRFVPAPDSDARRPPELRGVDRDGVRLLVVRPSHAEHPLSHRVARDLPDVLDPGDLLVVNTSATLPAAVTAVRPDDSLAPLHVSTVLDDGSWVVEPRRPSGGGPDRTRRSGDLLRLPGGVRLTLHRGYPADAVSSRLWTARPQPPTDAVAYLTAHGRPIEYDYLDAAYDLDAHQNVYAVEPGSAESPSAGRPLTADVLVRLLARGVTIAPVVLHCQVSSPEAHELPLPERFEVPTDTARLVRSAMAAGRWVVAVGTTVVRALESAVDADGVLQAASGWTDRVVAEADPPQVVTGLLTGLHAPQASHLLLLEALAGPDTVARAYAAAVGSGYLWHEFGDCMLFLP